MKLISCAHCAVILDGDQLSFKIRENEDGSIDKRTADYNQNTGQYEAYVKCPVCKEKIFQD